ncbi:MAG: starch-binding protein [Paludibacteraceae bacterium]
MNRPILTLLLSLSCSAMFAAGTVENRGVYATNPNNQFGKQATITIDGNPSDWTPDMLIAQGSANDVCNSFKGMHENCVLDCYALYAAWDDANLYLAWQMVNTFDTWWEQDGNGPISDDGYVGNVPLAIAISVDPAKTMTGRMVGGGMLWDKVDVVYETPVDHLFMMSGQVGQGAPAMFLAADAQGNTSYDDAYCQLYSTLGISYKMSHDFLGSSLLHLYQPNAPEDAYNDGSIWLDVLDANACKGKVRRNHQKKYDSFYEIKIPFAALGITQADLTTMGIGVMMIATRGESGIDCLPHDASMLDNVYGDYVHDASTSAEKSDSDTIRCQLADVGCRRAGSAPAAGPSVGLSIAQDYTFHSDALALSCRIKNATSGTYRIGNAAAQSFTGNASFVVGADLKVGESVQVTVTATNGTADQDQSVSYTYTKGEAFSVGQGTAILKNEHAWAECYCYIYGSKENAKWPGVKMTLLSGDFYAYQMPSSISSGNVIFNNGLKEGEGKEQYPSGNGLSLSNKQVRLYDYVQWYDVNYTGATALEEALAQPATTVRKVLYEGRMYLLLPGGKMYTIDGKRQ